MAKARSEIDVYGMIADAVRNKRQVLATYHGLRREMCPHVLGRGPDGQVQALFYQFGGESSKGLPPGRDRPRRPLARRSAPLHPGLRPGSPLAGGVLGSESWEQTDPLPDVTAI